MGSYIIAAALFGSERKSCQRNKLHQVGAATRSSSLRCVGNTCVKIQKWNVITSIHLQQEWCTYIQEYVRRLVHDTNKVHILHFQVEMFANVESCTKLLAYYFRIIYES